MRKMQVQKSIFLIFFLFFSVFFRANALLPQFAQGKEKIGKIFDIFGICIDIYGKNSV